MKICLLTHTFPRFEGDTAAPFMGELAAEMAKSGNEVFVLAPFSSQFNFSEKRPYKIVTFKYIFGNSLHKLGYSQTLDNDMGIKPVMYLLAPLMILFGFLALLKLIREEKIEIISAHWILPNGFIAALASVITGVPVVSTLPGSDVYIANKNIFFKWMALFAAKISKAITSNSPQLMDDLVKIGADYTKSYTIVYGVDPDKFKPDQSKNLELRKKYGISTDKTIILSVGRLVAKKGFLYLVDAATTIISKNKNVVFMIIGEGDLRAELENKIKEKSLSDFFILPGWVSYKDLKGYYNLADIFILPSIRDEAGNLDDQSVALVEAMACGRPVVTSNFPGYKIIVENKINGLLVEEKNSTQIATALQYLISSKSIRDKMREEARNAVVNRFSWPKITEQYLNLFQKIINNSQKKYYSQAVPIILEEEDRLKKSKQILSVVTDYVGETKQLSCLDMGCSSGVISNFLANNFKKVVGIDTDQIAINLAKNKFKKKNLEFKEMSGEKMDFTANSFDMVICHQVYNFVDDPEKLVAEIYQVLKKGGSCFFSARNKYALIEPQYHLPLLSWLPQNLAEVYFHLFHPNEKYFGNNYFSYTQLKKLVRNFKLVDYTPEILKDPRKFKFSSLEKYSVIFKVIPHQLLIKFIPNYIWVLVKN